MKCYSLLVSLQIAFKRYKKAVGASNFCVPKKLQEWFVDLSIILIVW